jgi:hypothetical protein
VHGEVDTGDGPTGVDVQGPPEWYAVASDAVPVRLLNSTGVELRDDHTCGDRDYFAPEEVATRASSHTFACSGAAVLFRTAFLRDVGPMDERFFLYYEDVDLCWRGRLRGWRFRYVADAVVVHEHSATVGSGSRLAGHLAERNRLVLLTKVAPRAVVAESLRRSVGHVVRAVGNDVVRRAVRGRRPELGHVAPMARVLLGYARLLPHALADRRRLARRSTVDRRLAMQRD